MWEQFPSDTQWPRQATLLAESETGAVDRLGEAGLPRWATLWVRRGSARARRFYEQAG